MPSKRIKAAAVAAVLTGLASTGCGHDDHNSDGLNAPVKGQASEGGRPIMDCGPDELMRWVDYKDQVTECVTVEVIHAEAGHIANVQCDDFDGNGTSECVDGKTGETISQGHMGHDHG